MSEVIPPSSAPLPSDPPTNGEVSDEEGEGEKLPITESGQVCYERVLPSQAHYYKVPSPPECTGKVWLSQAN